MENYYIGTSGWNYKDWKGLYYPDHIKQKDWLSYFHLQFNTVEINSSFYHLTKPETVVKWVNSVPDSFKFCPKISRYISHMKKLNDVSEPVDLFFKSFDLMAHKMGPVLVQLPKMVPFNAIKVETFYKLLRDKYRDYAFALEARHGSWTTDESLSLMKNYNISWVISQSGVGWPYLEAITAKDVYIRFHGPEKLYASMYPDDTLSSYAEKFKQWIIEGHRIWAYFNNDYFGYAIKNATTLKNLLNPNQNTFTS